MKHFKLFSLILSIFIGIRGFSQDKNIPIENSQKDSLMIRKIYHEALENGKAYGDLRELCKNIGNRLSGSVGADMAIDWGYEKLQSYGFDKVYLQEVMVPHWERGTKEKGYFKSGKGKTQPVNILALGGSIGTDGILSGEVVMFKSLEEFKAASNEQVEGKIVFLAERMNQKNINTFRSYNESGKIRWEGPIIAGEKKAKGYIMRSLSLSENDFPNTGVMRYKEGVKKVPSAAISTNDATRIEKLINEGKIITFFYEMNCKTYPDKKSNNVIGEITGVKYPDNIITVGGHLDSWDVGEGAHDDGVGIVHSMDAVRILKKLNYQPQNTIRVVFFMNEENGNRGGKKYAKEAKLSGQNHIYAIESDAGGFTPRGFTIDGQNKQAQLLKSFAPLFEPYFIHYLEKGFGGVDINPLKNEFDNIALFGFAPDSQRYFDIHHNENDVFENINKRELHLGVGAIASLIYLLDSRY